MDITEEAIDAACLAGVSNYQTFPEPVQVTIRDAYRRVLEAAAPHIIWEERP